MSRTRRKIPSFRYESDQADKHSRDGRYSSGISWGFKAGRFYQKCSCGCEDGNSVAKRGATKVCRAFEKQDTNVQVQNALSTGPELVRVV